MYRHALGSGLATLAIPPAFCVAEGQPSEFDQGWPDPARS